MLNAPLCGIIDKNSCSNQYETGLLCQTSGKDSSPRGTERYTAMQQKLIRNIARPDDELVDFFDKQTAADVHEAMGKQGAMTAEIGPVAGPPSLCGPAVTAHLPPGDNTMVHAAASVAHSGDVLVFETGNTETASWGESATRNALRIGLEGVVSDGNVRDVTAIDGLGLPVFSRAVSQRGARKEGQGAVNVPVSVGGTVVRPGDIVVGDADGVTVVPQESAEHVQNATEAKRDAEGELREKIANGESLPALIGIEQLLAESDVDVVEDEVDYSETGQTRLGR
jgi:4-hydroxy-4-methyl-2-oxoglutarate aldolase